MRRALYRHSKMYSDVKSVPSKSVKEEIFQELYLITTTKTPYFVYPDGEQISPKPGATVYPEGHPPKQKTTVPQGRRSKRKVRKPTKRCIKPSATSTKVSEPAQKAICDPIIETSAGASALSPDKTGKTVEKPKAIPKASTSKKGKAKESRRYYYPSKANYTPMEMSDFLYGQYLMKADLHLRSSCKENFRYAEIAYGGNDPPVKNEGAPAESVDQNSIMSPEIPSEVGKKQDKPDIKKPDQIPAKTRKRKQEKKDPDSGSSSDKMYILSDALAGIIGHQQEPEKKHVKCDAQISKKMFRGKRRIRVADMMKHLSPHLVPV